MFTYFKKNIKEYLPECWDQQIIQFAHNHQELVVLTSNSLTSREKTTDVEIPTLIVDGCKISAGLPWLFDLYRGVIYDFAKKYIGQELFLSSKELYGVNLNIQKGIDMRYECHVDSNPLQGILYVTSHGIEDGGELIVSNTDNVYGMDGIKNNCTIIRPNSGDLILFDARENPHYVEPLKNPESYRIAVTMNFYTLDSPESERPTDLNQHLFN